MKKIYIVDISAMIFRAFYAIRPLTSPTGLPVNALYGYLSMIIKLLKDEKPDYLAICYDRKEPSFRKDLYAEYKSNRTEMPEDLQKQMPYLRKLNEALGFSCFEKQSYEADDLIGAIAEWGLKHQLQVYIVSGDKDFAQLVKPNVFLYDTMKNTKLDTQGVIEKWGVKPEQFRDYLGLMGDSSDNVPGVEGVGPKGAQKLINDYGSLDGVYENIEKISGKLKERLIKDKENAYLSKKLVTIETDIPLDLDFEKLTLKSFHNEELKEVLEELNFKSFLKSLLDISSLERSSSSNVPVAKAELKTEASDLPLAYANSEKQIQMVSLEEWVRTYSQKKSYFFMWDEKLYVQVPDSILEIEKPAGETDWSSLSRFKWSGFDVKSVWKFLGISQVDDFEIELDSMLVAYVISSKNSTTLDLVLKEFLKVEIDEETPLAQIADYLETLNKRLEEDLKNFDQVSILYNFEYPLIPILFKMEKVGFLINSQELKEFSQELKREIESIELEVHKISGDKFNLASPKQLSEVLFKKLGLEVIKKTKTGISTDNEVLEKLNHPIAKLILDFRELSKLKSTYVDVLPTLVSPIDHRIHTTFNQALTTTGRLSSSNPNLQNIPIKTLRGQRVRKSFIADKNKKILSLDYSQIELRVLAHFTDDPGLKKAFHEDIDVHTVTASEVFNIKISEVTADLRRIAKAVNFGIAYGQGAFGLAETLGIPRGEAMAIIKNYFDKFKNVKTYIEETVKTAHEKNYVETLFGRRRYLPELQNKSPMIKKFGERAAINAPIQGTASDIVKLAMIKLNQAVSSTMILQVHDELLFEGEESSLMNDLSQIKSIMENVVTLKVPLKVNYSIGNNWDEAH